MATSPAWLSTDSRARQVLDTIARHDAMTVRQLVAALGVTTTAVRQQVNRLVDDGWLLRRQQQGTTGRPADVFSLAPRARRLFGGRADELARTLVRTIVDELGPNEGRKLLRAVGHRLAEQTRDGLNDGPSDERLLQLAQRLQDEGDVVDADRQNGHLRLAVFTCPYGGQPDQHGEICELERQAFSEVVGQPVKLERRSASHPCCEFTVVGNENSDDARADSEQE